MTAIETQHETCTRILASQFPKACKCGASYYPGTWGQLPCLGKQVAPDMTLEYRNCACGSTIAVFTELTDAEGLQ